METLFPFFDDSPMALSCGGPDIVAIIVSYCDVHVMAFLKLHRFETDQLRHSSAWQDLLLDDSVSNKSSNVEMFLKHAEEVINVYAEMMYSLDHFQFVNNNLSQSSHFSNLKELKCTIAGNFDILWYLKLKQAKNDHRAKEIHRKIHTNMKNWQAGGNVYGLPPNYNISEAKVNDFLSKLKVSQTETWTLLQFRDLDGFSFEFHVWRDHFTEQSMVRLCVGDHGRGVSLLPQAQTEQQMANSRIEIKRVFMVADFPLGEAVACCLILLILGCILDPKVQAEYSRPKSPLMRSLWRNIRALT
jgi:hypothetical protein